MKINPLSVILIGFITIYLLISGYFMSSTNQQDGQSTMVRWVLAIGALSWLHYILVIIFSIAFRNRLFSKEIRTTTIIQLIVCALLPIFMFFFTISLGIR